MSQNPGPGRDPCGECGETVKRNEKGVCCELCLCWFHARCLEIKDEDYVKCTKRVAKWLCLDCERNTSTGISSNDDADESMYEMINNNLKEQGLKVAHLNVDGMRSKLSQIRILLQEVKFDILAVSESKISNKIEDNVIKIEGYNIYRSDRNVNGGGVLIYYKESLNLYIEEKLGQYEGFEAAWINIVAWINMVVGSCLPSSK